MAPKETGYEKTNWPIGLYLVALFFAYFSLAILTLSLDGPLMNRARFMAQSSICAIFGLRLAWAVYRREQSKAWVVYVVVMFCAVPIWWLVVPSILSLGR